MGGALLDVVRIVTGFTAGTASRSPWPCLASCVRSARRSRRSLACRSRWSPPRTSARRRSTPGGALGGDPALFALMAVALRDAAVSRPSRWRAGRICRMLLRAAGARPARPAPLRAACLRLRPHPRLRLRGLLLDAELPSDRLARALFGFNAGVELGQVAAVLALWPLLQLAARWRGGLLYRAVIEYGSAVIPRHRGVLVRQRSYG